MTTSSSSSASPFPSIFLPSSFSLLPTSSLPTPSSVATLEEKNSQSSSSFKIPKFPRTWVPLASAFELDPDRPTPVYFLNQRYVIYQATPSSSTTLNDDLTGGWVVMDDACPHRLAPLSEGRVMTEMVASPLQPDQRQERWLQCSYHGWSFDRQGHCRNIPQMEPSKFQKQFSSRVESTTTTPGSSGSHGNGPSSTLAQCQVRSYPVRLEKNLIWIWPWTDQDPLSVAHIPEAHPEVMVAHLLPNRFTYTRDLPYGWDTLMENILDPSHIPFAHHGLQGSRNDATPIQMSVIPPRQITEQGFIFEFADRTMKKLRRGQGIFHAPFVLEYGASFFVEEPLALLEDEKAPNLPTNLQGSSSSNTTSLESLLSDQEKDSVSTKTVVQWRPTGQTFNLTTVMIPTRPGHSRIIIFSGGADPSRASNSTFPSSSSNNQPGGGGGRRSTKEPLMVRIFRRLPPWVLHQLTNRGLDSDLAFLHYQERELQHRQQEYLEQQHAEHSLPATVSTRQIAQGYFIPAQADRAISALRQWIRKYAHTPGPLPPLILDSNVLFDRWQQHSEQCRHCQKGAKDIQNWRKKTYLTMSLAILLVHRSVLARLMVVASIMVLRLLAAAESSMRKGGFRHYENH